MPVGAIYTQPEAGRPNGAGRQPCRGHHCTRRACAYRPAWQSASRMQSRWTQFSPGYGRRLQSIRSRGALAPEDGRIGRFSEILQTIL